MPSDITLSDYPVDTDGKPVPLTVALSATSTWVPMAIDIYPYLGYTVSQSRRQKGAGDTLILPSNPLLARIHRCVALLDYYDNVIATSIEDSVATKVGDLEVSYKRQLTYLYQRAAQLVDEISQLSDVPVLVNKYKGNGQSYSVRCPV